MYCPHCGVNNDRGEAECYICGKPLPSSAALTPESPAARRSAKRTVAHAADVIATVGDRALALFFDRALIASAMLMFAAWETSTAGGFGRSASSLMGAAGIYVALLFIYHALLEGTIGTTLGKSMMALRVTTTGEKNRFVASLLRNLLRIIDGLFLYLVGFIAAMFTARRQRVGDIVGGSIVMEGRSNTMLRAGMMLLWVVLVGVALWMARGTCPTCGVDSGFLTRAGLIR